MYKNVLYLLIGLLPLVWACNKNDVVTDNDYYIKAVIDDTLQTFTQNATATYFYGDWSSSFNMSASGSGDENINIPSIMLSIYNPSNLTTGVYTAYRSDSIGHLITGIYYKKASEDYKYVAGADTSVRPFQITISELTNTVVRGSFYGKFAKPGNTSDSVIITNGEFRLPVTQ